jgi:anti-anti-sigma factor
MNIRPRKKQDVIILDLSGKIDVDSAIFVGAVGQCVHEGYKDILCNFEDVESIDYMGISALLIAYKEVLNNQARMKFMNVPAHLKGVLAVSGLDRTIEIFASEDMALNSFKEDLIIENIKKMQLRRRFKRLPIDIKIEMHAKYDKAFSCINAEVVNLSAVGAFVFGCDKFKLGDDVILKLRLPPQTDEMELEAKVVWIPDKHVQIHFHPGIGVEFRNISIQDQEKLASFIDKNASFLTTD